MKLNEFLRKIDTWSALILLVLFYVFMVSGYMITRGLFSRSWGLLLHTNLDLPIMAVFSIHFALRLRFFLIRRKLTNGPTLNIITSLVGLIPFSLIVYLAFFFHLA